MKISHVPARFVWLLLVLLTSILTPGVVSAQATTKIERYTVTEQKLNDLKSVFGTVRSKDLTEARVRTPGTVVSLKIDEGASVQAGQVLALVTDPKLALQIKALDAQILGLESRVGTARLDWERAQQLRARGVTPQSRVDQLKTALDVAENELKSARSQRLVVEQQASEGQVLAPANGRVLKVPVTAGSVVLAGESVATIAANELLLRLSLPERHARFMKPGDVIKLGGRGSAPTEAVREGKIVQVYPELQSGHVIADAEAPGLGNFFIGERALVWISVGHRQAIVVPDKFLFRRFGQDYARLLRPDGTTIDVVIEPGQQRTLDNGATVREVLAGLRSGDVITTVASKP